MHTRNSAYFAKIYPMWELFHKMRMEHDPNGVFMNSYLKELFSASSAEGRVPHQVRKDV